MITTRFFAFIVSLIVDVIAAAETAQATTLRHPKLPLFSSVESRADNATCLLTARLRGLPC